MPRHKHAAELETKLIKMIRDAEREGEHVAVTELRSALTLLRPPHSDADAAAAKILASALRRAERDRLQHTEIVRSFAAFVDKMPIKWQ
jgi:hypothetical protein